MYITEKWILEKKRPELKVKAAEINVLVSSDIIINEVIPEGRDTN